MSAVSGIFAGLVTAAGVVALYRYAERRAREIGQKVENRTPHMGRADTVIDFEKDTQTGAYRQKPT